MILSGNIVNIIVVLLGLILVEQNLIMRIAG